MIYTVTFNPALDYVMQLDRLTLGAVNRTQSEEIFCGGKGINVSLVLGELGVKSCALGFTAGFVGDVIRQKLSDSGVECSFITLPDGNSRINVKIGAEQETELNARGPDIPADAVDRLLERLCALRDNDWLVLAGSVPASLESDIYCRIMEKVSDKNIRVAVDAAGDLLLNVLEYRPFLIKPNLVELGELFGEQLSDARDAACYAKKLQRQGARNVLVSMAAQGAVLVTEHGECFTAAAHSGRVISSVGAGDSMVAGFIAGLEKGGNFACALRLATAAGGATAFSRGLATAREIDALLKAAPHKACLSTLWHT